jgi:hypothetical protein
MRFFVGYVIIGAFILWLLYRVVIARDIKQHMPALYAYGGFALAWTLFYLWVSN